MRYRSEVVVAVEPFYSDDDTIQCLRETGEALEVRNGCTVDECELSFHGDDGAVIVVVWTEDKAFAVWVEDTPADDAVGLPAIEG